MTYRPIIGTALLFLLASGCGTEEPPRSEAACIIDPAGAPLTTAQVLAGGPYEVGRTSFTLVDTTRGTPANGDVPALDTRTLDTQVWYPATAAGTDAPVAAGGPFPVIVYSHGFSSFNAEGTGLNLVLASLGYVVFAPNFPLSNLSAPGGPTVIDIANQPGDLSFVIDSAIAMDAEAGHLLEGAIDEDRIAAIGLSLGGLTTLLVTFHATLHDPRIDVAAAMAPTTSYLGEAFYDTRVAPLLLLSGDIDAIVNYDANAVPAFQRANPPVNLYTLIGGTHTGYTSIAAIFETANNADELGCSAISGSIAGAMGFDFYTALGGAEAGLVPPPAAPPICEEPLPYGMRPSRQLEITIATISSFLESYLASDPVVRGRNCHYHERVFPAEASDVEFARR